MSAITGQPIETQVPVTKEAPSSKSKWLQLALITSGIAITIIASLVGILPLSYALAAKMVIIALPVNILIAVILRLVMPVPREENSGYSKYLNESTPFELGVAGPIVEEVLFRGILQGGLLVVLKRLIPATTVSILGMPFTIAGLIAIVTASAVFGAVHAMNDHKGAWGQAIVVGVSALFTEGPLAYFYGIEASMMAHILNNTIISAVLCCKPKEDSRSPQVRENPPVLIPAM